MGIKMGSGGEKISNKIILPLRMPEITSYPIYTNPCAIMEAHDETREWLLSNFIQLCSNTRVLNFYDFNYRECPFLNVQKISKKLLKDWKIDILQFIIYNIQHERYVYLLVSTKWIPVYNPLRKTGWMGEAHNLMIYGCDTEKEIFYIADNFDNGKYEFSTCTFAFG